MDFLLPIIAIILLVLINAFFVLSEYSLVTIRRTRIEELIKKGDHKAKEIKNALIYINDYISTTQLGTTFTSIAIGFISESIISQIEHSKNVFLPYYIELIIITAIILFFIIGSQLIFGEYIPKIYALNNTENIIKMLINPLALFVKIFNPLVKILNYIAALIINILPGSKNKISKAHSEDEIKMLLSQSGKSGLIPSEEIDMIFNIFQLKKLSVNNIMIANKKIIFFEPHQTIQEVQEFILGSKIPYNRFPVFSKKKENFIGFINVMDIFQKNINQNISIHNSGSIKKMIKVSKHTPINKLLGIMNRSRIKVAAIQNDHNKSVGIITLADIVSKLIED